VSDKYRFGDVGTLLDRPKWLRFKPALTWALMFDGIRKRNQVFPRGRGLLFLFVEVTEGDYQCLRGAVRILFRHSNKPP
jgi:hypothetical protein